MSKWKDDEIDVVTGLYDSSITLAENCRRIQEALTEKGYTRNFQQIRKKISRLINDGIEKPPEAKQEKAKIKVANTKQMVAEVKEKDDRIKQLEDQVRLLTHRERQTTLGFSGNTVRFGIISDTHLGSIFDNNDLNEKAYDVFQKEGIETVLHAGDICEGMYARRQGHAFELRSEAFGYDLQVEYAVKHYPKRDGITTKVILGNHDATFLLFARADICAAIAGRRPDVDYVGDMEATVHMQTPSGSAEVTLFHPGGGGSYAVSYKLQKYIEALTGGDKPSVFICGHHHKSLYMNYRNVHAIHAGTTMSQSLWMKSKNIAAEIGFWIIEMEINEVGVVRFTPTFFKDFS